MKKFNCPSCGAEIVFQSNVSVYAVCAYCSSMVVRRDIDVESIGKMAALPDDMSPLMIGTEGLYQQTVFRLVGRLKMAWTDGNWNEWYFIMENGGRGWLAEAQGFYAVCTEFEGEWAGDLKKTLANATKTNAYPDAVKAIRDGVLGKSYFLNGLKYKAVDIKAATCVGSEGELPFAAPTGRKSIAIDLLGHQGEFGGIEIAQDGVRLYLGQYMEWDDLKLEHIRPLEDW